MKDLEVLSWNQAESQQIKYQGSVQIAYHIVWQKSFLFINFNFLFAYSSRHSSLSFFLGLLLKGCTLNVEKMLSDAYHWESIGHKNVGVKLKTSIDFANCNRIRWHWNWMKLQWNSLTSYGQNWSDYRNDWAKFAQTNGTNLKFEVNRLISFWNAFNASKQHSQNGIVKLHWS